jgi:hypothetical protein
MTASDSTPVPGFAAAKGIALGLGLLLIAGTALLITLLVTRESGAAAEELPPIPLQAGERISSVSLDGDKALFVVEDEAGTQRVLLVNLEDGTSTASEPLQIERTVRE